MTIRWSYLVEPYVVGFRAIKKFPGLASGPQPPDLVTALKNKPVYSQATSPSSGLVKSGTVLTDFLGAGYLRTTRFPVRAMKRPTTGWLSLHTGLAWLVPGVSMLNECSCAQVDIEQHPQLQVPTCPLQTPRQNTCGNLSH